MKMFSSKITVLSAVFTVSLGFSVSASADDSEQTKSSLMSRMTSSYGSFISTGIGTLISPNFNTVEVSANLKEDDSSVDMGVLRAYSDNPNSFIFNQINLNRFDKRTTLNLGLGYRRLNADETWMTGVNTFYDLESPDYHKRNGVGFELISSILETRVNMYNGITGYVVDKSGTPSKALDGRDMGFRVALPYLPGMLFGMNAVQWKGIDGMKDKKSRKYTLSGNLSDNVSISYERHDYKSASFKDTNSINLNYSWGFGVENTKPKLFELASSAYELKKLGDQRYGLVKREGRIVKKKTGTLTVSGY